MAEVSLQIIGHFRGPRKSKASLPRQGALSKQSGYIQFEKGFDHKSALKGLEEMSHAWLIFFFHQAKNKAKPLVRPPRAPEKLVGLYATRAPYRPSPVGLSLVKIEKVDNGKLWINNCDLLDGTPILDIKPYVTQSDYPESPNQGWIESVEDWSFKISPVAKSQMDWLEQEGVIEIYDVLQSQLGTSPFQKFRKRITIDSSHLATLSYRTWRFEVAINIENKSSLVLRFFSGYSKAELNTKSDPYKDKELHRRFTKFFD